MFGLGGLFGILLAGFFAGKNDFIEFPEIGDFRMDSLMDVLPAGFMREARDLSVSFTISVQFGLGNSITWILANCVECRKENEKLSTTTPSQSVYNSAPKAFAPTIQ